MALTEVHWLLDLVNHLDAGVCVVDRNQRIQLWNAFMENFSGVTASKARGQEIGEVLGDVPATWIGRRIEHVFDSTHSTFINWQVRPYLTRFDSIRPITGPSPWMYQNISLMPLKDPTGEVVQVCVMIFDVTELAELTESLQHEVGERRQSNERLTREYAKSRALLTELQDAQSQLLQSEKMASLGQLAAGVAHEINNPIGYVNSNLGRLQEYTESLLGLLDSYDRMLDGAGLNEEQRQTLESEKERIDLEFLRQDLGELISESREGTDRVRQIVQNLKEFSHVGNEERVAADLNAGIESTLNICWNELKYKAEVVRDYGDLPPVSCIPSQLNQVFLNLLVNAAQAIEGKGEIRISTSLADEQVEIRVEDDGKGMEKDQLSRIFDPFFTTKAVGQGTGLGLSIAYGIVERHGGSLTVSSEPGRGSCFTIRLPVGRTDPGPDGP
jgi:two-component system NtrC family sensor kinase